MMEHFPRQNKAIVGLFKTCYKPSRTSFHGRLALPLLLLMFQFSKWKMPERNFVESERLTAKDCPAMRQSVSQIAAKNKFYAKKIEPVDRTNCASRLAADFAGVHLCRKSSWRRFPQSAAGRV